jgi:hypothetical protein
MFESNYLPPFAAKLKNKGPRLRKGWGTLGYREG